MYVYVWDDPALTCSCTDNVSTLFRASTLATMLMDQLMKLTAMDYLHRVLKEPVQAIADLKDAFEVHVVVYVHVWTHTYCTCGNNEIMHNASDL